MKLGFGDWWKLNYPNEVHSSELVEKYDEYENNYEYGEDFELDELRANANISKILKGKVKRKKKKNKPLWETP